MYTTVTAIALMFSGEALTIEAELLAARRIALDNAHVLSVYLPAFAFFAFGGALLVAGYIVGYLYGQFNSVTARTENSSTRVPSFRRITG